MDVHIQSRDGAEQLGSAALLAAFDDLMVSEYTLEPGTEPRAALPRQPLGRPGPTGMARGVRSVGKRTE